MNYSDRDNGVLYTIHTAGDKDCKTHAAENNRCDYLWCEHDRGILDAFPLQNRTVLIDISPESARMSPIQKYGAKEMPR